MLDLLKATLNYLGARIPHNLTAWIAGTKAETVVRAISTVQRHAHDQFDKRLTPRALVSGSDSVPPSDGRILTFVGRHPSASLYGADMKIYIGDLLFALAIGHGTEQCQIEEALVKSAQEEEERAQIVEKIIADLGLCLDTIRRCQRASVRHINPDALTSSHAFVLRVVTKLVECKLMKEEVSRNEMAIFDVACRLSAIRGEGVKLPDFAQVEAVCEILQGAGARNVFATVSCLNDVLCFHIEDTPNVLCDLVGWLAADDARLKIIPGGFGRGLYQFLLVAREHGIEVLDSVCSLVVTESKNDYQSVNAVLPVWRLLFKKHFEKSSCLTQARKQALAVIKGLLGAMETSGCKGDSAAGLGRLFLERYWTHNVPLEEANEQALTALKGFLGAMETSGCKGNSAAGLGRLFLERYLTHNVPLEKASEEALTALKGFLDVMATFDCKGPSAVAFGIDQQ